jgi:hypothetical protein
VNGMNHDCVTPEDRWEEADCRLAEARQ